MAFTASGVFKEFIKNPGTRAINAATAPTTYVDLLTDSVKVALFNNTTTPDKDAVVGSTGFNTGVWLTANEVTDTSGNANWASGGRVLAGDTYAAVTNAMMYDGTDLAAGVAGTGTVTLTTFFGSFLYDDTITAGTVADQGVCFNYFGGTQTVTLGTFTIIWHVNGIFRITV